MAKFLPKKWKSELKLHIFLLDRFTFPFLVGILLFSTLFGAEPVKKSPCISGPNPSLVTGEASLRRGQRQLRFAKERPAGSFWLETSCSIASEKSFCCCRSICGSRLLLLPSNRISHSFNYWTTNQALKVSDRFEWDFCKPRFQTHKTGMFCNEFFSTHKPACFLMFFLPIHKLFSYVPLFCGFFELGLKKEPWVRSFDSGDLFMV